MQVPPGGPAAEPVVDGAEVVSWDAESGILELRTSGAGTVTVTR
ncbi:hypothetical protein [Microbacterium sp. NC79]|nr:hypothetical protein [Microbacterium sp. NC79]